MTLHMPGGLQHAFELVGLEWPQADEDKCFEAGDAWRAFATDLRRVQDNATKSATTVWQQSTGASTDAFQVWWNAASGPDHDLESDAEAADLLGDALTAFGGITIGLKTAYIAQLIALAAEVAQAIATAFITFGASLAEIPGFAFATRMIVKGIVKAVVSKVETVVKSVLERAKALLRKFTSRTVERPPARSFASTTPGTSNPTAEMQYIFGKSKTSAGIRSYFDDQDAHMHQLTHDLQQTAPSGGANNYVIGMHGTEYTGFFQDSAGNSKHFTPQEMGDLIRQDPNYTPGRDVGLMMCNTGAKPDGFAQQLADHLGVSVTAPDKLGWVINGKPMSSSVDPTHNAADGTFKTFHPRSTPAPSVP